MILRNFPVKNLYYCCSSYMIGTCTKGRHFGGNTNVVVVVIVVVVVDFGFIAVELLLLKAADI